MRDRQGSQLPEINLVPMMDVLMTVLTFFIIVSMTLTGQQMFKIDLPLVTRSDAGKTEPSAQESGAPPAKLTLGINAQGQVMLTDKPLTTDQLVGEVQKFLTENPKGIVLLKADRQLNYSKVTDVLRTLRDIGGDRVFLGIEQR